MSILNREPKKNTEKPQTNQATASAKMQECGEKQLLFWTETSLQQLQTTQNIFPSTSAFLNSLIPKQYNSIDAIDCQSIFEWQKYIKIEVK